MSFATPGMTNDFHGSNMQTQQRYFSNTGQIDFKSGVRISHEDFSPDAPVNPETEHSSESPDKSDLSFSIKDTGQKIVAQLTPIAPTPKPASDVNNLTVAENSKRLARMICDMGAGNEQEYTTNAHNGLRKSVNSRGPYAKYNNLRSHLKAADPYNHDKFDLLVQEFIDNGNPDLHTWINMNPKRQMMTYREANGVHEGIVNKLKQEAKQWINQNSNDTNDDQVPEMKSSSNLRLEKRVSALELEQQQLVEAGFQNRQAIKEKVGHLETGLNIHHAKLDAHAMELKNLNSKTMMKSKTPTRSPMPTKSPTPTNKQLREGFSKTVTTPVAMDFEAMNRAISKAM